MMNGAIGKKIGMTRVFDPESGETVAVTVIYIGKNYVCQVKSPEKDGYSAVQLGFDEQKPTRITKPVHGHMTRHACPPVRVLKEFSLEDPGRELTPGETLGADMFEGTSTVDVTAVCKGRGFSGTVRRHNFSIGRKTHGNRNQRQPGSIGASADPSRVFPGQKMPGQYGNATVTMRNLQLVQVDKDNDVLLIKGSVPGKNKGVVYITKKKTENKPENK